MVLLSDPHLVLHAEVEVVGGEVRSAGQTPARFGTVLTADRFDQLSVIRAGHLPLVAVPQEIAEPDQVADSLRAD